MKRRCLVAMERSANSAQFSPALGVLFLVVGLAVTVYIYHKLIIQTLIYLAISVGLVLAVAGLVALAVSFYRYNRKRTRAIIKGTLEREGIDTDGMTFGVLDPKQSIPASPEREQMKQAADVLGDEGVELSWSADGQTLQAKRED